MGYAQWVVIVVSNLTNNEFKLTNVKLHWGKWHQMGDKDAEIVCEDPESVCSPYEEQRIRAGQVFQIASCGRENSPTGTNGEFDLYDSNGYRVCHIYWDCPWRSSGNTFTVSAKNNMYDIAIGGENLNSGALGDVHVKVTKKHYNY